MGVRVELPGGHAHHIDSYDVMPLVLPALQCLAASDDIARLLLMCRLQQLRHVRNEVERRCTRSKVTVRSVRSF